MTIHQTEIGAIIIKDDNNLKEKGAFKRTLAIESESLFDQSNIVTVSGS